MRKNRKIGFIVQFHLGEFFFLVTNAKQPFDYDRSLLCNMIKKKVVQFHSSMPFQGNYYYKTSPFTTRKTCAIRNIVSFLIKSSSDRRYIYFSCMRFEHHTLYILCIISIN